MLLNHSQGSFMNTSEQIVEAYFRICRDCLTVPDVKVPGGHGRQLDLLAYCLRENRQYHIEVHVSHAREFAMSLNKLFTTLSSKFLGTPTKKELKSRRQKSSYIRNINDAYRVFGFDPIRVERIWVCWELPTVKGFAEQLANYNLGEELNDNPISILSFREEIIPSLKKRVKTAHYDDVSLRTISLFKQGKRQGNIDQQKANQQEIP